MSLRYVSLFDGIGAACVAWKPLGWQCVGKSEIEPFPIAVTKTHQPDVPHLGSVSDITEEQVAALGRIDLIVGGFPCQDLSVAGKRAGLKNEDGTFTRSGLFFDAMRVVRWARKHCGLRWLLIENVPGLYSSNGGRDFAAVVGEMAGADFGVPPDGWRNAGVAVGPDGFVEWATLDAQFFGLAQRRVRVFALADFGDWQRRPPVLLERDGMSGHPPPQRQKGQSAAPTLAARTRGGGGLGTDFDCDGGLVHAPDLARCDATREGSSQDWETTTMVAHALRGEAFDITGTGPGMVTGASETDVHVSLRARPPGQSEGSTTTVVMQPIAFHPTQEPINSEDVCHALNANANATAAVAFAEVAPTLSAGHNGSAGHLHRQAGNETAPVASHANGGVMPAVAVGADCFNGDLTGEVSMTLKAAEGNPAVNHPTVVQAMQVRRLTPRECERLQGFPDDYTLIPYRGKPAADGPRYKALGNSMAVPVMNWIGRRIQAVEDILEALKQAEAA